MLKNGFYSSMLWYTVHELNYYINYLTSLKKISRFIITIIGTYNNKKYKSFDD